LAELASEPRVVCVYAPGSISNLGPGFDCLGVAVTGAGDRIRACLAGPPGVRVLAVDDPRIPLDSARNTAALAAAAVLRRAGREGLGLELRIEKGLPLAGGLGGSAASAVAGALAAQALIDSAFSKLELCEAALEAEASVSGGRHADNVAPAMLGGAVLVRSVDPLALACVRVWSGLEIVLASPAYQVETRRARAVLPATIARGDAVAQASNLGALILGLERGEVELLRGSLEDRIAEPARAALFPGHAEAREAALKAGALGVAVSGAGPTILALSLPPASARVAQAFERAYRDVGHAASVRIAQVDQRGAVIE